MQPAKIKAACRGSGLPFEMRRHLIACVCRAWKPFASSARRDNTEFSHWVRAHAEFPDYPFAKFNRRADVVRYSDEEYNKFCMPAPEAKPDVDQDARWPRDHTDKLFELARQFDLRWPLVYDRWPLRPVHSIEDMKQRFYTVTARIIEARKSGRGSYPMATVVQLKLYDKFEYNSERDQRRRKQLDMAFRREAPDMAEEMSLRAEIKAIDAALTAARLQSAKNADKGDASAFALAVSLASKQQSAPSDLGPSFAASYSSGSAPSATESSAQSSSAGSAFDVAAFKGASLRSEQMAAGLPGYGRGSRTMKKVNALLHELGVPPAGKLLPAAPVYAALVKLKQDATALFQLQRAVMVAEQRTYNLQQERQALANKSLNYKPPAPSSGSSSSMRRSRGRPSASATAGGHKRPGGDAPDMNDSKRSRQG